MVECDHRVDGSDHPRASGLRDFAALARVRDVLRAGADMGYRSTRVGSVCVVRWDAIEPEDLAPLLREVRQQAAEETRFAIIILPAGTEAPSNEMVGAMGRWLGTTFEVLREVHFVVEGTGFEGCVLRGVLSTAVLGAGRRRRVFFHSALLQAVSAIGSRAGVHAAEILNAARERSLSTVFPRRGIRSTRPPKAKTAR